MALRSRRHRRRIAMLAIAAVLALVVYGVARSLDEPLRRYMEREVNRRLTGYTVHIQALRVHPWSASLALFGTTVTQEANPEPPVMRLPRIDTSVDFRALLHRRIVADVEFARPAVYLDLEHVRAEARGDVAVKDRGWQRALEALTFDLEINRLSVSEGDVTYVDGGPFEPLHVAKLNLGADNIRNVRSRERTYPSEIHLDGAVFGTGRVQLDGHADFLAEPHLGLAADLRVDRLRLGVLRPIADRYNVSVRNGSLSLDGSVEYAPSVERLVLNRVRVQGVALEYVHRPQTARLERARLEESAESAKRVAGRSDVELRIDRLDVVNSQLGFVNEAATPAYRLVLADADLRVEHLSNQRRERRAALRLEGELMGSGSTELQASLQPRMGAADLDLTAKIERADMARLRDLVRAYGGFDARAGRFSLYSELATKGGAITGYVKPLFHDVEVGGDDAADGGLRHRLYEGVVGIAAKTLKNRARGDVATVVPLSGRVDRPDAGVWTAIGGLLRNAFIKSILPGFDARRSPKSQRAPRR